jgi:hypothetical protein
MATYAAQTGVSSEASRAEIERTLRRYKATSFMYGWEEDRAVVGFVVEGRQIRFILPMPNPKDPAFTHTPARRTLRSPAEQEKAYEQGVKQRWRALNLVIKSKLEAVEAGIVTFDEEFGMHFVLPSGRTVAQEVLPAMVKAYELGHMPTGGLLQIEAP